MKNAAELITECIETYNVRDFKRGAALFTEDSEQIDKALNSTHIGPKGRMEIFESNAQQFSDSKTVITEIISDGDRCAYVAVFRGTNDGPMPGNKPGEVIAATGKKLEIEFMGIVKSKNGKITSSIKYYDSALYSAQLGNLW